MQIISRCWLIGMALTLSSAVVSAAPAWLLASDTESATAGQPLRLEVVKPLDVATWPDTLQLRLTFEDGVQQELLLLNTKETSPATPHRTYQADFPRNTQGLVRAELAGYDSNRLALLVAHPLQPVDTGEGAAPVLAQGSVETTQPQRDEDEVLPALSVNEPMYFLVGKHASARFQLSFKYRLFDPDGFVARPLPMLGGMYFGYTQTSFWDLGRESKPFRDTSYRPSLFWQGKAEGAGLWPESWRAGYEHESNGRDNEDSRSIDMLFMQPTWQQAIADSSMLVFSPKFHLYLDRTDNPDIQRYRGYAEWAAQYGKDDGWLLSAKYRQGTAGYASVLLDASYPLGARIFSNIGSFVHLQWFSGYGETLLDYDKRNGDQLRIGISIVR